MIGEIILLKIIPNLNHKIFKGVRAFEFKRPNIRNNKDKSINA